jgi:hypothetical protein
LEAFLKDSPEQQGSGECVEQAVGKKKNRNKHDTIVCNEADWTAGHFFCFS